MISPVETIADALIAFILSLIRDPEAAAEFTSHPSAVLVGHDLQHACMSDVAAVRPVIVDRPDVVARTAPDPPSPPSESHTAVTNEISRMVQQFTTTIDARSTIVDNSVNQSIWTDGGDVTQVFDQEAIIASGDGSVAAAGDATLDNSDLDITTGDVSIGNETYDGSFNTTGADAATEPAAETPAPTDVVQDAPVDVAEPADLLEADMTVTDDSYEADAASAAAAGEPALDDAVEED